MGEVNNADKLLVEDDIDCEPVDFQSDSNNEFVCTKERKPEDGMQVEYTLCMIKPSAMKNKNDIVRRIKRELFHLLKCCQYKFTPETASEFYEEHYGKTWFPKVILKMCLGPVFVMCLAKEKGVEALRTLCGPPRVSDARKHSPLSLRAVYGLRGDMATNGLHASANREEARREIFFFFRDTIRYVPSEVIQDYLDFLKVKISPLLNIALLEMFKTKPGDPLEWLAEWLLKNNPMKPHSTMELMIRPSNF